MGRKKGAKKKQEEGMKLIPIIFRVCRAEHMLVRRRASILGMNVSAFLRLLIARGRVELEERKQKSEERGMDYTRAEAVKSEKEKNDQGMTKAALPTGKRVKSSEEKTNQGGRK